MAKNTSKSRRAKKAAGIARPPSRRVSLSDLIRSGRFRFAAAFGLSCLGFHALVCVLPPTYAKPLCDHTALTLAQALSLFGVPAAADGNVVSGSGLTFLIVLECTALFMMALFTCFVCFYPSDARHKAIGLAAGIPALYLGNLVRLTVIFVVSRYNPRLFDLVHVYLGQVFTMFLVILSCLLWLKWVNRGPASGPVSKVGGFLSRFALISGCMFLVWMEFHHWYVWTIDRLMILGFSFFGYRVFVPPYALVYYETFAIVTFTSLILATRVTWPRRVKTLAAGLCLFFLFHLFHRIDATLMSAFGITTLFQMDLLLCEVGQILFPVLLWLVMTAQGPREPKPLPRHR